MSRIGARKRSGETPLEPGRLRYENSPGRGRGYSRERCRTDYILVGATVGLAALELPQPTATTENASTAARTSNFFIETPEIEGALEPRGELRSGFTE